MSTISADHLARRACVYIRQSTPGQVQNNLESQRRQYALADRARQLGWTEVEIIDDDLGCSGGGIRRPGFERLLSALCDGKVGAVLSIEASRLARNGRDWHTLLEFCGLVGALLIDAENIYDPAQVNDKLLLGIKGTISEMEVATFRERAQAASSRRRSVASCSGVWRLAMSAPRMIGLRRIPTSACVRPSTWHFSSSLSWAACGSCIFGCASNRSKFPQSPAWEASSRSSGSSRVTIAC